MPILTLQNAQLAYGELPLLDRAALAMESGERLGLIGRNGTGKSSLLGAIAGRVALDDGELRIRDGLRIAMVEQEPVLLPSSSVKASLLGRATVRQEHKLNEYLQRFGVDPELSPETLSGGETKRAALALAFALEPDLLLLDEPTNHLDIDGIVQLENFLLRLRSSIVITHDRAFLDRVATRIVELDRGRLFSFAGNFSYYEETKTAQLASEAVAQRKFDKFWAEEEVWIRKGVQARNVRNQGRVARLERLREERAARRERVGGVKMSVGSSQRSGKLVCELTKINKGFAGRPIVKDLDLIITRGDRIGLVGPNGAGKTTLIKLILGSLAPDSGTVRLGTNVQPAYFDQMREALDPEKTVAETISPGSEWVELQGGRKHVMSYLGDFLFPPRRANSPVRMLSGGERNRLLLARLFARPANVLVLDEPTNDLDIESLELLEAALQDYDGTLLLVSHDRAFLDNVVTQTLAPEAPGSAGSADKAGSAGSADKAGLWREYAGGYSDYVRQRPDKNQVFKENLRQNLSPGREKRRGSKLSYKETREIEALPNEIQALELEQKRLSDKMCAPDYFRQPPETLRADQQRNREIDALLHEKLERWESLEAKAKAAAS